MSDERGKDWEDMVQDERAILVSYLQPEGIGDEKPKDPPIRGRIARAQDFMPELYALRSTGLRPGESSGWPSLDTIYSVRPKEWTLLTGIPSHGKSSFLDNVMVNLAASKGWRWGVFSAENLPLERHAANLMALWAGKPFNEDDPYRQPMTDSEFNDVFFEIDLYFRFVMPPENDTTVEAILKLADEVSRRESLNGIVIDPWNELDHSRPSNMSETEYISRALTQVRRFAREHDVHVFVVAHPTKLQRIKTTTNDGGQEVSVYPVPTPYDVAGSAHFRNKADNCLCVWRDVQDERSLTQIHVQKIRFREVGRVGICELAYDRPTGQFLDPAFPLRAVSRLRKRQPGDDDE